MAAAAIGTAVLTGALMVGDSVRGSLRELGLQRLLGFHHALHSGDRFFRVELFQGFEAGHSLGGWLPTRPGFDPMNFEFSGPPSILLNLPGTGAKQDNTAFAGSIQVFGILSSALFPQPAGLEDGSQAQALWMSLTDIPPGGAILNEALAAQLNAKLGEEIVLRIHKPSALSRDAVISPQDEHSIAMRVRVHSILKPVEGGDLSLRASQLPSLNAFVRWDELSRLAGLEGRANLALMPELVPRNASSPVRKLSAAEQRGLLDEAMGNAWDLPDAQLGLRGTSDPNLALELISSRIFLDPPAAMAAFGGVQSNRWRLPIAALPADHASTGVGVLTYLVNLISTGSRSTPYSMVTAAGAPWTPQGMADDEIMVTDWLSEDLSVKAGDLVRLTYYVLDAGSQLLERTQQFKVRGVVPMQGLHSDRTLMPEFPGLAKAESTRDWDAGFKLVHEIRNKDEDYWKKHRGSPKAFITLPAGQQMWSNRFGSLTAVRYPVPGPATVIDASNQVRAAVLSNLDPGQVGLRFEPVREQALAAASQAQDFGQLFIGFSFFLIAAAIVLMGLLFQFGVERRQVEIGTLLATGFPPSRVRRVLLSEGVLTAASGALVGLVGAVFYAESMMWALGTLWRAAVGSSSLSFRLEPATLVIGWVISVVVCGLTISWVLRKHLRRPARELLKAGPGETSAPMKATRAKQLCFLGAIAVLMSAGIALWLLGSRQSSNAPLFFAASALGLVGGLALAAGWIGRDGVPGARSLAFLELAMRGMGRRRSRSLAAVFLLGCGSFLVVSIGAHRLESDGAAQQRSSGTGGFTFIAESSLPITRDLDTAEGREALGLGSQAMEGVRVVGFRVRAGDDASCLNLNRAQRPRILGVDSSALKSRDAFTFAAFAKGVPDDSGWEVLRLGNEGGLIAAVGDSASIQWAMGRKLGDEIEVEDDQGRTRKLRLSGGIANSILQGSLILDEREFERLFPSQAGRQLFLIDAPLEKSAEVAAELSRALRSYGFQVTSAEARLAQFNAVQNTYLGTFQLLGGLGLGLGSLGLGVVLARNAYERRGELSLLKAIGFSPKRLRLLILVEHTWILLLGLGVGAGAALIAILPQLLDRTKQTPVPLLTALVMSAALLGLGAAALASRYALSHPLTEGLRQD